MSETPGRFHVAEIGDNRAEYVERLAARNCAVFENEKDALPLMERLDARLAVFEARRAGK